MTKQEENLYRRLLPQLRKYLMENGKRCTSERTLILQYCCELKAPITFNQLAEAARKDRICAQTIYDTLDLLVGAGILQRIALNSQQVASYAIANERRNKARIICTECGRVSSFRDQTLKDYFKTRVWDNFEMKNYSIYVYGQCKTCRKGRS